MKLVNFLNDYSGLLMFIVTTIYVVATVYIYSENKKSVIAAKEQLVETKKQLKESKRQFRETMRLENLPFLQIEIPSVIPTTQFEIDLPLCNGEEICDYSYNIVLIKNIGKGAATNIIYSWIIKDINIQNVDYPQINGIMQGDTYNMQITSCYEEITRDVQGVLLWEFDDMLGNKYKQKATIYFENRDLVRCENDTPELIGRKCLNK